ncbi:MAG: helix-turn-helix transcriptional regulator [Lachnospiraceae bacterium]
MAKSEKQKLKLLYIMKILMEQTDEEHPMPMSVLLEKLAREDIKAERKSIYSDVSYLQDFGLDIVYNSSRDKNGYYIASREFELPECKLLVDAVTASKFITASKSKVLVEKLESLVSRHQAHQLKRQVVSPDRIKNENESIYYRVDGIHKAMQENKQITFQYLEWNLKKNLVPRKGGLVYQISPWALLWDNENYYLVGYDHDAEIIKHFRVDKIGPMELLEEKREGYEAFTKCNIHDYSRKTFGMYGGEEEKVTIQFPNSLVGVVLDRFGKDVSLQKIDAEHFAVHVTVAVSSQFFGWLAGIGNQAKITSPEEVKKQYVDYLQNILTEYTG